MHRCAWCDEHATVVLVGSDDSRVSHHYACPTHDEQWGRLYRRSVRLRSDDPVVDLRDPAAVRDAG